MGGVSGTANIEFRLNTGGTWQTLTYPNPGSITGWHQYAATFDGGTMSLYVDGALAASQIIDSSIGSVSGPLYLAYNGAYGNDTAGYLKGSLDEVRFYDANLSASQIATLYSQASLSVTGLTTVKNFVQTSNSPGSYHAQSFDFGANGINQYGDISGGFAAPGQYLGSTFIQTANADNQNANFSMSFGVNTPTTVYVLLDSAISSPPSWLTGAFTEQFTTSGQPVTLSNGNSHTFTVYKSNSIYAANGTITLGANGGNSSSDMYSVLLAPLAAEYVSAAVGSVTAYSSQGIHTPTPPFIAAGPSWPINAVAFPGTTNNGWWVGTSIESFDGDYNDQSQGNPVTVFAPTAFGGANYSNTPVAWAGTSQEPGGGGVEGAGYMGAWAHGLSSLEAAWAGHANPSFIAVTDIELEQYAPLTPVAPTLHTLTVVSSNQINLSWTVASQPGADFNLTGYGIWRAPDTGHNSPGTFSLVGSAGGAATSYSDTYQLAPGTKYWYQVEAYFGRTVATTLGPVASGPDMLESTSQASATTVAAPSSLVAYWRLDEGSGSTANDTATGGTATDNGTLVNGPTWTTGHNGNALSFNGVNQYVTVSNSTDLNITGSQITVVAWVKSATSTWTNSSQNFISSGSYILGEQAGSTLVEFSLKLGGTWDTLEFGATGTITNWNQYAGTYDGSTMRLYDNGTLLTSKTASGSISSSSSPLYLGQNGSTGYLNGSLDDARIYNTKLTDAAIASLYGEADLSVTGLMPTGSNSSGSYHAQSFNFGAGGINQYGDVAGSFSAPGQYLGSTFIQTANADNTNTNFSLTFTIYTPSTVYVLFDNAIPNPPSWLTNQFTSTNQTITNSAGHRFTIYRSVYQSGTITLGANDGNVNSEMYSVLFAPLAWDSTDQMLW